jgi:hypothetical protein
MIISPVSNRFNAGLGDLPLLFPDAGVIDQRYYEVKPLEASGTPYFQDGRILLPPTFAWGNRVANAPPNLGFPGFMNVNRTQDFSISLTKVWERHTIKAGFYLNHSYKAQNLGAGGGASFQGNISFANDPPTRSTRASATPMRCSASSPTTSSSRSSWKAASSTTRSTGTCRTTGR